MGTHRDWPPLHVQPGFSPRLALFTVATHLLALLAVWGTPIGDFRFGMMLLVAVSAVHAFSVHILRRAPWSIRSATWQSDGTWLLTLVSGREIQARLSAATFVSVPLVILSFGLDRWRRRSLPVPADAIDPDQLRRLRQRLRIRGRGRIAAMPADRIA